MIMTPLAPIRRVAIIGAGAGGAISGVALALLSMRAGFPTALEDILPSNLRRAAERIGATDSPFAPRYAGSIEDAVCDADLVLDTVPDELESKLEIFTLLDRMAPPAALFATPTEVLSIADLASCTYRAGQCFGLRFLALEPIRVALTYPSACAPDTLERMRLFLVALGAEVSLFEDTHVLP